MHVEHPKHHLTKNVAFPADPKLGVVRSVGIYGANASGKSNVLRALAALQYIACLSGDLKEDEPIPCYEPFLLAEETKHAPIRFEIEFFNENNLRFRYEVSFNAQQILEEVLDFYPSRQKANLFRRSANDTWETVSFGGLYKGGARKVPFFKNNSYLAKAGNSAASPEIIRSVYRYLILNLGQHDRIDSMLGPEFENDEILSLCAKFLCHVDTGISDVNYKTGPGPDEESFPKNFPSELRSILVERSKRRYFFSHKNESGGVEQFQKSMESEGTQKLFSLLPNLIRTFEKGRVLIVDELDSSFHPHIADLLVDLFNDPEINTGNAQLIFSTHNRGLMSSRKMRRDQIWFVQKEDGKSSLYSLADFEKDKVKSDSPFDTWYDEGRFGALPSIDYNAIGSLLRSRQNSVEINLEEADNS